MESKLFRATFIAPKHTRSVTKSGQKNLSQPWSLRKDVYRGSTAAGMFFSSSTWSRFRQNYRLDTPGDTPAGDGKALEEVWILLLVDYIPLANRVLPKIVLWVTDHIYSTSIYGRSAKQEGHELKWKKPGAVTYRTDQENEVSKKLLESLGNWIKLETTPQRQAVCNLKWRPLNQAITAQCDCSLGETIYKYGVFAARAVNKWRSQL